MLVVAELTTLADLGLIDSMLAWRERLGPVDLRAGPHLDRSTRGGDRAAAGFRTAACSSPTRPPRPAGDR